MPSGYQRRDLERSQVIGVARIGVQGSADFDRDVQAWVLENGWYDPIEDAEQSIRGDAPIAEG